jgi:hypothetical protein
MRTTNKQPIDEQKQTKERKKKKLVLWNNPLILIRTEFSWFKSSRVVPRKTGTDVWLPCESIELDNADFCLLDHQGLCFFHRADKHTEQWRELCTATGTITKRLRVSDWEFSDDNGIKWGSRWQVNIQIESFLWLKKQKRQWIDRQWFQEKSGKGISHF